MKKTFRERYGKAAPVIEKLFEVDLDEEIEMDHIFTDMFGDYADVMYSEFGLNFDLETKAYPDEYSTDQSKQELLTSHILHKLHPEWYTED